MTMVEYKSPAKPPSKPKVATPLEFFEAVYMNPDLPVGTRLKAATEAAKYVHPRVIAISPAAGFAEEFARSLDRRVGGARNTAMINAKPLANGHRKDDAEIISAEKMGKAFQPSTKRRF